MRLERLTGWLGAFSPSSVDVDDGIMSSVHRGWAKLNFGVDARIQFYDDVGLLLEGGVPLEQALTKLHDVASYEGEKPNEPLAVILADVIERVKSGDVLSLAMAPWVSSQETILLATADETGELQVVFPRIVWTLTEQRAMTQRLWKILGYPAVLWIVAYVSFAVIGYVVVPELFKLLPYEKWHGSTLTMIDTGLFFSNNGIVIPLALGGLTAFMTWALPNLTGKARPTLDRAPVFNVYRIRQGITFMIAMASMLPSGVGLDRALVIIAESSPRYLRDITLDILDHLRDGDTLGNALYNSEQNFPDRKTVASLQLISDQVGFEHALERYTRRWLELNIRRLEKVAWVLRILGMVAIGAAILIMGYGSLTVGDSIKAAYH